MMPDDALRFTRWVAGFSITAVILGSIFALYVLQMPNSSFIPPSLISFVILWLTNLISMLLNAVYWFIRRAPKGLAVTLLIQAVGSVITFIPVFNPD